MFTLVRIQKGVRVYPGIKDLPAHIRPNFRNKFIRYAIKQVANSEVPWTNPDVDSIQSMYQIVYRTFPAKIRHSDAVYHLVSNLLPPPVRNMVFFELFLFIFHNLLLCFTLFTLFSLCSPPQEKTICGLLIPRRSQTQRTTTTDDPF